jgi:hypothetical protein
MAALESSSLKAELKKIILQQVRLHPGFKVEDLYKLLFQAVFGPGHLLHHHGMPMLQEEMANLPRFNKKEPLKELLKEPLFERIDPKGDVHRINLRPYQQRGGDPETLFAIMMESAQAMKGSQKEFLEYWDRCETLARAGSIPFTEKALTDFRGFFIKEKMPVIHHSPAYMEANQPAYRLGIKKFLKKIKNLT